MKWIPMTSWHTGDTVYLNISLACSLYTRKDGKTTIGFAGDRQDYVEVKESADWILEQIK